MNKWCINHSATKAGQGGKNIIMQYLLLANVLIFILQTKINT